MFSQNNKQKTKSKQQIMNILISFVNENFLKEDHLEEDGKSEFQWFCRDLKVSGSESKSKFSWVISSFATLSTDILEKYVDLWLCSVATKTSWKCYLIES